MSVRAKVEIGIKAVVIFSVWLLMGALVTKLMLQIQESTKHFNMTLDQTLNVLLGVGFGGIMLAMAIMMAWQKYEERNGVSQTLRQNTKKDSES